MKNSGSKIKISEALLIGVFSFVAGGINGFVGAGGGIIIVYLLGFLYRDKDDSMKDNFARTILVILPMSLLSLLAYVKNSNVDFNFIERTLIPTVSGGALGAVIMDRMDRRLLSIVFAIIVVYSGISMIIRN